MHGKSFLALAALAAFVPVTVVSYRGGLSEPGKLFWLLFAVAVVVPSLHAASILLGPWDSGLSQALWVSLGASLLLFAACCLAIRDCWRLTPIVMPYLFLLGALALATGDVPSSAQVESHGHQGWLMLHIGVSVLTYGLTTLAAMSALAAFLQERALKRKAPSRLTHALPSIADAERLEFTLLGAAEIVLGAGLVTGMALRYLADGVLLSLDHKTLLSILAFVLIAAVLALHSWAGLRGRQAGRLVLLVYLLLTLAYPGVKFVTDLLIA